MQERNANERVQDSWEFGDQKKGSGQGREGLSRVGWDSAVAKLRDLPASPAHSLYHTDGR